MPSDWPWTRCPSSPCTSRRSTGEKKNPDGIDIGQPPSLFRGRPLLPRSRSLPPSTNTKRSHLFRDPHAVPHEAPGLPAAAVQLLSSRFARRTSLLACDPPLTSRDGSTTKLLLRLAKDGAEVEAVIMRYDTSVVSLRKCAGGDGGEGDGEGEDDDENEDEEDESAARSRCSTATTTAPQKQQQKRRESGGKRATLCVSSQVGCAMGCTFCATGTMGKLRSLSAAEILEQADFALAVLGGSNSSGPKSGNSSDDNDNDKDSEWRLRNVVMMGMGEPLDAYPAVVKAVKTLTDSARFGLRRSAVTVSTVGVVPRIKTLARDLPGISLALSLHAPTQELRQSIVPSARSWPLHKLLAAVDDYQRESRQRVFIEYVLLSGVNDSVECGLLLGELLAGKDVVVNLIPWNPVEAVLEKKKGEGESKNNLIPPETFAAPGTAAVDAFVEAVRSSSAASSKGDGKPLPVTVRAEKGQDIAGACGQLVVAKKKLESEEQEQEKEGRSSGGEKGGGGLGCFSSPAAGASCSSAAADAPPATPARDIEELAAGAGGGGGGGARSNREAGKRAANAASDAAAPSSSGISGVAGTFASWLGFR